MADTQPTQGVIAITRIDNPVHTVQDSFPPLAADAFKRVNPTYRHLLRINLLPVMVLAIPLWWLSPSMLETLTPAGRIMLTCLPVVLWGLLALFWVPRRYHYTGYLLREHDIHLCTGALWRQTTSVTLNRVQHIELSQGPMERYLGCCRLLIYTAGGAGQDLSIPGVDTDSAEQIRAWVLARIESEDTTTGPAENNSGLDDEADHG